MNYKTHILLLVTLILVSTSNLVFSDESIIHLNCVYDFTIDEKGQRVETSGEELFTIKSAGNNSIRIKKDDVDAEFIGIISDETIYGITQYKIDEIGIKQEFNVNRYNGKFSLTFESIETSNWLIYYGKCKKLVEKLF